MRWLDYLAVGAGMAAVACGGSDDAEPFGPVPGGICAVQHEEGGVAVCDELHSEAPYVRLPEASAARVFAGLQNEVFIAADGTTYAYPGNPDGNSAESQRHAIALYELELSGNRVTHFRPLVTFDEALFVQPFLGRAFEGTISRRDGEQYTDEATLPVRVEVLDELIRPASRGRSSEAPALLTNLDHGVTLADGSCVPALTSYGSEAPFASGAKVTLTLLRAPWMHGVGDDVFVFDVLVDGSSVGSMMAPTWYRGPIDLVRETLAPAGIYDGVGHGTPGSIPSLSLSPVDGGGQECTP